MSVCLSVYLSIYINKLFKLKHSENISSQRQKLWTTYLVVQTLNCFANVPSMLRDHNWYLNLQLLKHRHMEYLRVSCKMYVLNIERSQQGFVRNMEIFVCSLIYFHRNQAMQVYTILRRARNNGRKVTDGETNFGSDTPLLWTDGQTIQLN